MADLGRQKDSPIEIAHVVPIYLSPAADAQAQASVRGDGSFPHIVQKMWARMSVSTKSLIHSIADQSSQRNVLGASESFLWQQKRFRAEKVAVCRNERLNPQTLKGQALCRVWEKEIQCSQNRGISGENRSQSILYDRSVAFHRRSARNHSLLAGRLFHCSLRRRACSVRSTVSIRLPGSDRDVRGIRNGNVGLGNCRAIGFSTSENSQILTDSLCWLD